MARVHGLLGGGRIRIAAGVGIAVAAAVLLTAAAAGADGGSGVHVVVDGHTLTLPTPPLVVGAQVFLPLADLAQVVGLPFRWDPASQTVYLGGASATSAAAGAVPLAATGVASDPAAAPAAAPAGGSFTYQGLDYAATGLVLRPYPGDQNNSGTYWIVSYSITDTASTPIAVPAAQALVLFGPGGTQIAADTPLDGAAPTTLNPGITFTSYEVFNVPAAASPASYTLGFIPYQVVGSQYYAAAPLSMALPPSGSTTLKTPVNTSYDLQNMFSDATEPTSDQRLTLGEVLQTNAVAPDLTAASFDPTTSFWVVDFTIANKTSGDISVAASDFALDFDREQSLAPADVASLPGFVQPTGLQNAAGVTVPTGTSFSGSLLFEVPAGTPTENPQLQFSAHGETRIVSLTPCQTGSCPPVLG